MTKHHAAEVHRRMRPVYFHVDGRPTRKLDPDSSLMAWEATASDFDAINPKHLEGPYEVVFT